MEEEDWAFDDIDALLDEEQAIVEDFETNDLLDSKKRQFADAVSAKEVSLLKRPKVVSPGPTVPHHIDDVLSVDNAHEEDGHLTLPKKEDKISALDDARLYPEVVQQEESGGVPCLTRPFVPPSRLVTDIEGPSFEVTSRSGERVYCALSIEDESESRRKTFQTMASLRKARGGLLRNDFEKLVSMLEKETFDKALAFEKAAASEIQPVLHDESSESRRQPKELWVSKYAPSTFLDLLSDEYINREVVRWLKMWNPVVFGTPAPPPPPRNRKTPPPKQALPNKEDGLKRPEQLIIILAGPPGYGKTTLAHTAAVHCGYRPIEINASDDRSAGVLAQRVSDAVEMRAVGTDARPHCVILDEIDGALGGKEGRSAIHALVKLITAAPHARSKATPEENDVPRKGALFSNSLSNNGEQSRKKRSRKPLLRPIIAICNDLYAPALRPLREIARVFHVRKPSAERLAQRLHYICCQEGLLCEKSTLRCLGEKTESDIRSCLNTLQFLSRMGKTSLRASDMESLKNIGQKDVNKGAFSVWNDLLHRKKKQGRLESEQERALRLFGTLDDFGEHELVMAGIHENMLAMKYFDIGMNRTCALLDCLTTADAFLGHGLHTGDISVARYVPAPLVSLSLSAASHEVPTLSWPRGALEARRKRAEAFHLLQTWAGVVAPRVMVGCGGPFPLSQEYLPTLLHIAAPQLRPIAPQLYSQEESLAVNKAVEMLLAYGVRYGLVIEEGEEEEEGCKPTRESTKYGSGFFPKEICAHPVTLQPPVHSLVRFGRWRVSERRGLRLESRQMINHRADMEAIRQRSRVSPMKEGPRSEPTVAPLQLTVAQRMKDASLASKHVGGTVGKKRKQNWLDQLRTRKPAPHSRGKQNKGINIPVLYTYHEGYTNAVKRPVLTKELLA